MFPVKKERWRRSTVCSVLGDSVVGLGYNARPNVYVKHINFTDMSLLKTETKVLAAGVSGQLEQKNNPK